MPLGVGRRALSSFLRPAARSSSRRPHGRTRAACCLPRPTRPTPTGSRTRTSSSSSSPAIIFLLVEGALVVFAIRYRRGRRARTAEGPQIHGATRLEIIWTVVPVLILAAIGTFVFCKLPGISGPPSASAAEETNITVEGRQFYWLFHYPNGAVSVGTLVAPADQVVHEAVVSSDDDVNHSWWVPKLGGKLDAIPGRTNHTWFQAPRRHLRRPLRRALRDPARRDDRACRLVPRSEYDSFIAQRKADEAERRARQGGVRRRLLELPPARHDLRRPGARRQPAARPTAKASRRSCARASGRCRPSAAAGPTRRSTP